MIEMTDEEFATVYEGLEAAFTPSATDPETVGHIVYLENRAWRVVQEVKSRADQTA